MRSIFKKVSKPSKILKKLIFNKKTRKLNSANHRIKEKEQQILKEITISLGDDPNADVTEKLNHLNELSQVLDLQKKMKKVEYNKWGIGIGIGILSVLALLAILPGFPTPGHVEVRSSAVEITLLEDFEWSGRLNLIENSSVLLSNFTDINSPQSPELSLLLNTSVLQFNAASKLSLESLFIPKGTKLWLEWDEQESSLIFILTSSSPNISDDSIVRAEFKLDGDTRFSIADGEPEIRNAIPCPMGEDCNIPRRVLISTTLGKTPRIRLHTKGVVDLAGLMASQFSFSKYTLDDTKIKGGRCTVISGEYQFRGNSAASNLRKGECILVQSSEGSMGIEMAIRDDVNETQGFQVWYHGIIKSMRVGTPEFTQDKTPSLLAFIFGMPDASTIGSILGVILASGFTIFRVKQ